MTTPLTRRLQQIRTKRTAPEHRSGKSSVNTSDIFHKAAIDTTLIFGDDEDGRGRLDGYGNVTGILDNGGDIIVRGAFEKHPNVLSDFIHNGFTSDSHKWTMESSIGYPIEAYEDDNGLFIKRKFHSDADAQKIRVKIKERLEDGKSSGLSIGFSVDDMEVVYPRDYKRIIPKHLKPSADVEATLQKAQRFKYVRIIKSISRLFEDSAVPVPMNGESNVTMVKSIQHPTMALPNHPESPNGLSIGSSSEELQQFIQETIQKQLTGIMTGFAPFPTMEHSEQQSYLPITVKDSGAVEVKSSVLGDYLPRTMTWAGISRLFDILMWGVCYDAIYSSKSVEEKVAIVEQGFLEASAIAVAFIANTLNAVQDVISGVSTYGVEGDSVEEFAKNIRKEIPNPFTTRTALEIQEEKKELANLRFSDHTEFASSVVEEYTDRLRSLINLKAGRELSATNRNRVSTWRDIVSDLKTEMDDWLRDTDPDATSDDVTTAGATNDTTPPAGVSEQTHDAKTASTEDAHGEESLTDSPTTDNPSTPPTEEGDSGQESITVAGDNSTEQALVREQQLRRANIVLLGARLTALATTTA